MNLDEFKTRAATAVDGQDIDALAFSWIKQLARELGREGALALPLLDALETLSRG